MAEISALENENESLRNQKVNEGNSKSEEIEKLKNENEIGRTRILSLESEIQDLLDQSENRKRESQAQLKITQRELDKMK